MANVLDAFIPSFYKAVDLHPRSDLGFLMSAARDFSAEGVPLNTKIKAPRSITSQTPYDATPAASLPTAQDVTFTDPGITISKRKALNIVLTGDEEAQIERSGGLSAALAAEMADKIHALDTAVEADIAALYASAGYYYGTAATTPFGSNTADAHRLKTILDSQRSTGRRRSLVLSPLAYENAAKLLQKVNENGSDQSLREGVVGRVAGFDVFVSPEVKTHTTAVSTKYLVNGAGATLGARSFAVDGGVGGVKAGDIVDTTHAALGHANVVGAALAGASGTLTLSSPLVKAIANDADAVDTTPSPYVANLAFAEGAVQVATRTLLKPRQGDLATDRTVITSKSTGIAYEVAYYPQYNQGMLEVSLAWGAAVIQPDWTVILAG